MGHFLVARFWCLTISFQTELELVSELPELHVPFVQTGTYKFESCLRRKLTA